MRLFLLFILIFFCKNVSPLFIFVKFSWQDNGESHCPYYKCLTEKQSERFNLKLTNNSTGHKFKGITDADDIYYFEKLDLFRESGEKINNFNLQISFDVHNFVNLFNFLKFKCPQKKGH